MKISRRNALGPAEVFLGMVSAIALVFSACGNGADGSSTGQASRPKGQHSTVVLRGINSLANASDVGVVGSIVEVKTPDTFDYTVPHDANSPGVSVKQRTRDVVLAVEQVAFANANPALPLLTAGQRMTVTVKGDDEDLVTPCGQTVKAEEQNGRLASGERVLMLLQYHQQAPGPKGPRSVWMPTWAWQTVWNISGATAKSASALRNAPLVALLERLQQERDIPNRGAPNPDRSGGYVGRPDRDPGTEENPLLPPAPDEARASAQRCSTQPAGPLG